MYKIRSIRIAGFRGQQKSISLRFDQHASFIVGRNGTGKTTLINMINAALAVDLASLREAQFNAIELKFKRDGVRPLITVSITKEQIDDQATDITYQILESTDVIDTFVMSLYRRRPAQSSRMVPGALVARELRKHLDNIYKCTWLSIQRSANRQDTDQVEFQNEDNYTDVDRKLDQVLNDLVRYFSRLDSKVSEKTLIFQKEWFLSFLATERMPNFDTFKKIDMEEERRSISAIFEKFNVDPDRYRPLLDKHFHLSNKIAASPDTPMSIKDFFTIYQIVKLHSMVEQWENLQEQQTSIYLPKAEFVSIASSMLYNKLVSVNRSNQVEITSSKVSGPAIPPTKLSSGEKQLLIFMAETLLQEQEPYIFLADEPELSLHVEWQEELVPNILRINPNAQIIFATHSPDIVNKYQENIIQMEELID